MKTHHTIILLGVIAVILYLWYTSEKLPVPSPVNASSPGYGCGYCAGGNTGAVLSAIGSLIPKPNCCFIVT